jgi:hypothetical protein
MNPKTPAMTPYFQNNVLAKRPCVAIEWRLNAFMQAKRDAWIYG